MKNCTTFTLVCLAAIVTTSAGAQDLIFADGFETGNTSVWTMTVPTTNWLSNPNFNANLDGWVDAQTPEFGVTHDASFGHDVPGALAVTVTAGTDTDDFVVYSECFPVNVGSFDVLRLDAGGWYFISASSDMTPIGTFWLRRFKDSNCTDHYLTALSDTGWRVDQWQLITRNTVEITPNIKSIRLDFRLDSPAGSALVFFDDLYLKEVP